jgi:predicted murein hydrolase (TIGR00659 family)
VNGTASSLVLTLGAYVVAHSLWSRSGRNPLLNPTMLAIAGVAAALLAFRIPHADYFTGARLVHDLLGTAVVALAVPLYRSASLLRARATVLAAALVAGSVMAAALGVVLAGVLGSTESALLSIAPRSATAAVSMEISARIGGLPALTALLTIATGITGAMLGSFVLDAAGVRDPLARGFAIGIASHGIGTARAFQESEVAGTAAGLGMALNAMLTALWVPPLVKWLLGSGGVAP